MTIFSMFGFTALVLLVTISFFYLIWVTKRQKLEKESYELHQVMQKHYHQLSHILGEIEPLMAHDKAFYEELRVYVHEHHTSFPILGEVDGLEAKEFYNFLLHIETDAKDHLHTFSSPITQQLDQMKLSLMRARESFSYADNDYKFAASSFPINVMAKMLEHDTFSKKVLS
ncbi:hypothetical protein JHD50_05705 [Sulfurimonas sp. MAG313]|nr:hypothetical protein [Sulfurimonas sp. MAG313]MDF1880803.1 hypothetical protein [Sulfurimonas sp. MAG313]